MKKKTIYYLTFAISLTIVSIGDITFIDDGINTVTINLSDKPFSWLFFIHSVYMMLGIFWLSDALSGKFGKEKK